jgi:hypothetical protein
VAVLSLIPSSVGFVLFVYGKKQERGPLLAGGLLEPELDAYIRAAGAKT